MTNWPLTPTHISTSQNILSNYNYYALNNLYNQGLNLEISIGIG